MLVSRKGFTLINWKRLGLVLGVFATCAATLGLWYRYQYTVKSFPEVAGTILYHAPGPFRYVPSTGDTGQTTWGVVFQPEFLCRGRQDTLILWSGDPYRTDERRPASGSSAKQYFYKFLPITKEMIPFSMSPDTSFWCYSLDYDAQTNRYLCQCSRAETHGLLLLDQDFTIVSELTPRFDHPSDDTLMIGAFFSSNSIVVNYPETAWFYPIDGDTISSHNFEIPGRVGAVSNDKSDVYYTLGWKKNQRSYIFNPRTKLQKLISTNYMISAIFSPDDKFLALEEVTYNLFDDVKVHIYDVSKSELKFTGVRCWGLDGWIPTVVREH